MPDHSWLIDLAGGQYGFVQWGDYTAVYFGEPQFIVPLPPYACGANLVAAFVGHSLFACRVLKRKNAHAA